MSVREAICKVFAEVASGHGKPLPMLSDDLALQSMNLDSLCMVLILVRLEALLGIDPVSVLHAGDFPLTFGEFVARYEGALCRSSIPAAD